jgi:hypothetical protein
MAVHTQPLQRGVGQWRGEPSSDSRFSSSSPTESSLGVSTVAIGRGRPPWRAHRGPQEAADGYNRIYPPQRPAIHEPLELKCHEQSA